MTCTATSCSSQNPHEGLSSTEGRVASIAVANCGLCQERGGPHPSESAVIDGLPGCYYLPALLLHTPSLRAGLGYHARPLAVPHTVPAGKTTGSSYNYTHCAHLDCSSCSSTTCAAGYTMH